MQSTTTGGLFRRPLSLTLTAAFSALAHESVSGAPEALMPSSQLNSAADDLLHMAADEEAKLDKKSLRAQLGELLRAQSAKSAPDKFIEDLLREWDVRAARCPLRGS